MSEAQSPSQVMAARPPQIFAGAAMGIALLALAGWLTGVRLWAGQRDTHIPMAPSAARAFLHHLE